MMKLLQILLLALTAIFFAACAQQEPDETVTAFDPLAWKRPVDNPVFTTDFGNNHDSVLFVEPDEEYPYHLIVSHLSKAAQLWRANAVSWTCADWELVE
mgnify:FL=1